LKLLLRPYHTLQKLGGRGLWLTCGVIACLAAVEVLGRFCRSDWQDALMACVLVMVALAVVLHQRSRSLGWVEPLTALWRWVRSVWRRYAFVVGIDLRGVPALPQRCPGPIRLAVIVVAVWSVLIAAAAMHFPADARAIAVRFTYLGYLVLLIALWSALIFSIGFSAFVSAAMIHDRFVSAFMGTGRRPLRRELFAMTAYFIAVLAAGFFLPLWVPLVLTLVPLIVLLLGSRVAPVGDAQIVWKYHRGDTIWVVPLRTWVIYQAALVTLLAASLAATACGTALLGADVEAGTMPITSSLGKALVWLAPGLIWGMIGQLAWALLRDPARRCRPVLHIGGEALGSDRDVVRRLFRSQGWRVRLAPSKPRASDVCVLLTSAPIGQEDEARWPLRVTAEALMSSAVLWRLERRVQILQRRQLVGGLRKLFKAMARHKHASGMGCWIAPHLWFILGLSRDTDDEEPRWRDGTILAETIGPHYHRVLSHAARHHAYHVFRATQIDIILVEDGVGFRRFSRVLRMLFEIYDIHGGRRRAEDLHFVGIPGVRVIIHEFQLDHPFKSEVYPEPDYESIGRARVLHVFRDRGEHEEPVDIPADDTREPVHGVPSLMS
jgi:hypothetical protein